MTDQQSEGTREVNRGREASEESREQHFRNLYVQPVPTESDQLPLINVARSLDGHQLGLKGPVVRAAAQGVHKSVDQTAQGIHKYIDEQPKGLPGYPLAMVASRRSELPGGLESTRLSLDNSRSNMRHQESENGLPYKIKNRAGRHVEG